MNSVLSPPAKTAIARSFSKAAQCYDDCAELQRRIGHRLLDYLPADFQPETVADLGCGTGYFTRQLHTRWQPGCCMGLDIAEGMLQVARAQGERSRAWIAADAEQLPLAGNRLDLLFSNLALQWCHDFTAVLDEAYRVLEPSGLFAFTTLCDGTLHELRDCWKHVDEHVHVNRFPTFERYRQWLDNSAFTLERLESRAEISHYSTLKALMGDLKGVGAHNINPERNKALTSRSRLQALTSAYERLRTPQGLPMTYQVIYAVLRKS